ncbi:MAG: hypothetical protein KKD21_13150 [Proteobacteria bacterium]|nr:hypothetical protein [Pseudomonadota bacterium]MBU1697966.1 hypothetical protein [Pseudomonadota bacterium]
MRLSPHGAQHLRPMVRQVSGVTAPPAMGCGSGPKSPAKFLKSAIIIFAFQGQRPDHRISPAMLLRHLCNGEASG